MNSPQIRNAIELAANETCSICQALSEMLTPEEARPLAMSATGRDGLALLFEIIGAKNRAILEALENMEAGNE